MTIEDFFTLTEMKDGLCSITRVEELVSVIQNPKDCLTSNKGDVMRQWSTVASTLAATGHEECLNHFVQLNGLSFVNKWLQEALDPNTDVSGINVEEMLTALLASLEKFPIKRKTAVASGIAASVKQLLKHTALQIKDKAAILYDKWKCGIVTGCPDQEEGETSQGNLPTPCEDSKSNDVDFINSVVGITTLDDKSIEKICPRESSGAEYQNVAGCSEIDFHGSTENLKVSGSKEVEPSISDICMVAVLVDINPSSSFQDNSMVKESSACVTSRVGFLEDCSLQSGKLGIDDDQNNVTSLKDGSDSVKEMDIDIPDGKAGKTSQITSCDKSLSAVLPVETSRLANDKRAIFFTDLDSKSLGSSLPESVTSDPRTGMVASGLLMCETKTEPKLVAGVNKEFECFCGAKSGSDARSPARSPYQKKTFVSNDICFKDCGGDSNTCISLLKITENKINELGGKSELGLACADDVLEVARQVAIQVEREVVDYREPFCSSPDFNTGEVAGGRSTEKEGKDDPPVSQEPSGDSSSGKEISDIEETLCSELEKNEQDLESQTQNDSAQEPIEKINDDKCNFDLNADICSEEQQLLKPVLDVSVDVSTPIAIVASSRATPLLPVTLSHFQGAVGWKGSAATSAFRPASPRRTPDSDKALSDTNQKPNLIEIDLNVVEGVDEVIEPISVEQLPASSSLPSRDLYKKVYLTKAEKLNLDLNCTSDEDVFMFKSGQFRLQQNEEQNLPLASSSSVQHLLRDFDLNDKPAFLDSEGSQNFNKSTTKIKEASIGLKLDDPVFTIMGSKMAVERKNFGNHTHLFLPNGQNIDHNSFAGQLAPYAHMNPTTYGYNGLPAGSTASLPQAFYSPSNIPYMMDTRTQPYLSQIPDVGGLDGAPSARPPFLMSMPTGSSHSNLYGSFHSGFDLNSGVTLLDVGTKEAGSFKQLFLHGQNSLVQEQIKATPQSSSLGSTLKRKEPETWWEHYPYGCKQVTQWQ